MQDHVTYVLNFVAELMSAAVQLSDNNSKPEVGH